METTDDAVLGGRLRLLQPRRGHRIGHDAILLAAATGAVAGEHAVDFGAGIGGAGLALAARVPAIEVTLVEIDRVLSELAGENVQRNKLGDRVRAVACDVEDADALAAAGLPAASADRVLMNPPFNDPARQQSSPDARRRLAHVANKGLLSRWVASAARVLKPNGVLTLIWRAEALDDVLTALAPAFGAVAVLPVLPRPGAQPIRVLVRAEKGGRGRWPDYSPLVLNDAAGRPGEAAERVLREAAPLALAGP
ncbi:MAG: methyltransferase [Pseudolabrys sp.]